MATFSKSEGQLKIGYEDDIRVQEARREACDANIRAKQLFDNGKYEEALLELERGCRIVSKEPRILEMLADFHHCRAICYRHLGKYMEALNECKKAVDMKPGNETMLYSRACAYFQVHDFGNAIIDFEQIPKESEDRTFAMLNVKAAKLMMAIDCVIGKFLRSGSPNGNGGHIKAE